MRKWHFKQSTCRPVLHGRRDYVSKSDCITEARAVVHSATHIPVRADSPSSARPPPRAAVRFPQRTQAALLHSAETFLKNIPNVNFKQHFAMVHFKCNRRNLHTLNYFGGKEHQRPETFRRPGLGPGPFPAPTAPRKTRPRGGLVSPQCRSLRPAMSAMSLPARPGGTCPAPRPARRTRRRLPRYA